MTQFNKRLQLGMLAFLFVFAMCEALAGHVEDLGAIEAVEGEELELGRWYHGFKVCKKYAEQKGIPLFAIWTNSDCGICASVVRQLRSTTFRDWQQTDEGKILYCILPGGRKDYPEDKARGSNYMWMKAGKLTRYPFVALYWSRLGEVLHNEHIQGYALTSGSKGNGAKNAIFHIQEAFPDWEADVPRSPILDQWDPMDDTRAGAALIDVTAQSNGHGPHSLSENDSEDWFSLKLSPSLSETNFLWLADCRLEGGSQNQGKGNPAVSFYRDEIKILKTEKVVEYVKTNEIKQVRFQEMDWVFTNQLAGVSLGSRIDPALQGEGFQKAFWSEPDVCSFVYCKHLVQVSTNLITYGYNVTNVVVAEALTNTIPVANATLDQRGGFVLDGRPNLQEKYQQFTVDKSGKILVSGIENLRMVVGLSLRGSDYPSRFRYTLHAKRYLEQFAGLAFVTGKEIALTNSVTCPEKSSTLQFAVLCGGEGEKKFSGKLQFIDDGAIRGENYNLPSSTVALEKGFSRKANSTNLFQVAIKDDRKWNPRQDLLIRILPDDPSVHLLSEGTMRVTIAERSNPDNGTISLVSYWDPQTKREKSVSSSTKIILSEGDTVSDLAVKRSGGEDQRVEALLRWSDGGQVLAAYVWNRLEGGEQAKDITIPILPGFQRPKEYRATLEVPNAGVSSSGKSIRFLVYDSAYGRSVSDYIREEKPDVRMNTRGDGWFVSKDGAYTSFEGGTLTTSLRGPGVLSFRAEGKREGLTAQIMRLDAKPHLLSETVNDQIGLVIPSGAKTVELAYQGNSNGRDFVALYDLKFTQLSIAAEAIAPLSRAVLRAGPNRFSWDVDSIRLPGVQVNAILHRGDTDEEINCGQASTADILLEEMRSLSWWISVKILDDFGHAIEVDSKKQSSITVLGERAPCFDFSDGAPMGDKGVLREDGSGVVFDNLYTKMRVKLGPMALANGGDGVKKISGALPGGLKIESDDQGIFIAGAPSRAGTNSCVFQVRSGRTAGATLAAVFKVAALPADVSGDFIGQGSFYSDSEIADSFAAGSLSNGVMEVDISSSGKISGSIPLGGKKFTFKADGFDGIVYDSDGKIGGAPAFYVATELTCGSGGNRVGIPIMLNVYSSRDEGLATFSAIAKPGEPFYFRAEGVRNFWKDRKRTELSAALKTLEGYYTALIRPEGQSDYGSGYLTLTVSGGGSVKASGKLPDGVSISSSGTLLMQDGKAIVYLGVNPSSYKGGEYMGSITFDLQDRSLRGRAIWINRDRNHESFICQTTIEGGPYAKSGLSDQVFPMNQPKNGK